MVNGELSILEGSTFHVPFKPGTRGELRYTMRFSKKVCVTEPHPKCKEWVLRKGCLKILLCLGEVLRNFCPSRILQIPHQTCILLNKVNWSMLGLRKPKLLRICLNHRIFLSSSTNSLLSLRFLWNVCVHIYTWNCTIEIV